jgi:hypothetical protein
MSKVSSKQRLEVLKIWLDDLKKNSKHRKQQQKKASKWIEELDEEN